MKCNLGLMKTELTIKSRRLPPAFSGYRIAHISDLHNTVFGQENSELIDLIQGIKPDLIAVTGDLIDSRRTDAEVAVDFIKKVSAIAPVYYAPGNHESRLSNFDQLQIRIRQAGAAVLRCEAANLEKEGQHIRLIGVEDPAFSPDQEEADNVKGQIRLLTEGESPYTIVLCHRPELFSVYAEMQVDLALCGHAHGGQIRLPFAGGRGIIAPHQGFSPNTQKANM